MAFDFDIPYISLHAISRDTSSFPYPCIYCQLDEDEEDFNNDDEDNDEANEDDSPKEMYLVPKDDIGCK